MQDKRYLSKMLKKLLLCHNHKSFSYGRYDSFSFFISFIEDQK